jgi:serine/threonine protein kinase
MSAAPETAVHKRRIPAAPLLPDDHIGNYDIDRVLGQGGYGAVYAAVRRSDGRAVAIREFLPAKLVRRRRNGDVVLQDGADELTFKRALTRFIAAGQAMVKCQHPNLVTAHEVFEDRGTAYLIMDLVHGQRLSEAFKLMRLSGESQLHELANALGSALTRIHEAGFVHGEVQPDHILLTADETPMLLDFGGARRMVSTGNDPDSILLAKGYAAPEQYTTDGLTPATDMYGLGATLYRAISGNAPIDAPSRVAMKESGERIRSAVESAGGLFSHRFLRVVDSALVLNAERRVQDFPDFWYKIEHGAIPPESVLTDTTSTADLGPIEPAMAGSEVDEVFLDAFSERLSAGSRPDLARAIGAREERWTMGIWSKVGVVVAVVAVLAFAFGGSMFDSAPDEAAVEVVEAPVAVGSERVEPKVEQPSTRAIVKAGPESSVGADSAGTVGSALAATQPTAADGEAQAASQPAVAVAAVKQATTPRAASGQATLPIETPAPTAAPEPTPLPAVNVLTPAEVGEVKALIAAANADIKRFRLTSPAGNNAFDRLTKAQLLDPTNPAIAQGMEAIVDSYLALADRAKARGQTTKLRDRLERAETVAPGSPKVAQARQRLLGE